MSRYTNQIQQILLTRNGVLTLIEGAQKFFYEIGTSTKKTIYSDSALTIPQENPVLSDSNGRFPDIFIDGIYKEQQKDERGVVLWTLEPVGELSAGQFDTWATDRVYNEPDLVIASNEKMYRSISDSNQGNDPIASPSHWEEVKFTRVWNTNVTYALDDKVEASDNKEYASLVGANTGNNPTSSPAQWGVTPSKFSTSAEAAALTSADTAISPDTFEDAFDPSFRLRLKGYGADGKLEDFTGNALTLSTNDTYSVNGSTTTGLPWTANEDGVLDVKSHSSTGGFDTRLMVVSNLATDETWRHYTDAGSSTGWIKPIPAVLHTKVIDIGDWNMVANAFVFVAHGLDSTKIREVSAVIRSDTGIPDVYDLDVRANVGTEVGKQGVEYNATTINLYREQNGIFDGTGFDETSYNRGWITIRYTD